MTVLPISLPLCDPNLEKTQLEVVQHPTTTYKLHCIQNGQVACPSPHLLAKSTIFHKPLSTVQCTHVFSVACLFSHILTKIVLVALHTPAIYYTRVFKMVGCPALSPLTLLLNLFENFLSVFQDKYLQEVMLRRDSVARAQGLMKMFAVSYAFEKNVHPKNKNIFFSWLASQTITTEH